MGYLLTTLCRFFETLIASIAAHLSFSLAGIFFLAFPVAFSFSAYVIVILQKQMDFTLSFAIISALLATGVLGAFFAYAYTKISNDSYAVLTLASLMAFDAVVKSWDAVTGGVLGISGITRPELLQTLPQLAGALGLLAFILLVFEHILLKTHFGRLLRAHKESEDLINSLGTSSKYIGMSVIILACLLAGVSGIFAIWRIQFLDPSFGGVLLLLQILTIAILAQKPNVFWIVFSTLFVVMIPEALRFFDLPSSLLGHMRMLLYALLIIVLIKFVAYKNSNIVRSA
ncbi:branched-chain amino acid ABC transporter permease [Candidatus Peregrinibacteria bacterium]|jgi:branched-chain amino acid transport system permease protein|nr:branched-chain amino acid ABC transporter permease [Candidatus Peregrinibacteria bacterium]